MDFSLNEDQRMLRSSARDFLKQEWPAAQMRRMLDPEDGARAAAELWAKIAELGWPLLLVPEEQDGLGSGVFDLAVLMEEMGRRLVPGDFLGRAVLGTLLGSPDAAVIFEEDERLRHALGASGAESVLLVRANGDLARLAAGEVEIRPSLDPTRPLGRARKGARHETAGRAHDAERAIDIATVALASEMVGGAFELLDQVVAYVKDRKQFGVPVGGFQAVQHRAADMLIRSEKARSAVYHAALVADEAPAELPLAASAAKVAANQAYVWCSQQAIQLYGGLGFTWEQDLHLHFKRAKASEYLLGSTAYHLDRIAEVLGIA
jgi:alkylation response protein AidB-like acyl-CoA dehydrogenase